MTKEPHPDWTEAECWAWKRIQAGEIADFNEKLGETADPAKPEDWDERRTLRPAFWETIIEPCWREHLHRKGIRIVGALLTDEEGVSLDWQRAELPAEIWLDRAVVKGKVQFGCAKVPSVLSFAGSRFKAAVDMQGLEVGESLLLNNKAHFSAAVILRGAMVGGQLTASGSHFGAKLDMHGIKVGQNLFLHHEAYFAGALDLVGANIGGQFAASSSHFMAALDMQGLEVGQDLFLHDKAHFAGDVILNGAKIKGQLGARGSRFEATLDMQGDMMCNRCHELSLPSWEVW